MIPPPLKRSSSNILKTVEIHIYRTYIFLFLAAGNRQWYVVLTIQGGGPTDAFLNRKCTFISKRLEDSTTKS
jgi:hypothetical protein